jgi:hypothetical protein
VSEAADVPTSGQIWNEFVASCVSVFVSHHHFL